MHETIYALIAAGVVPVKVAALTHVSSVAAWGRSGSPGRHL